MSAGIPLGPSKLAVVPHGGGWSLAWERWYREGPTGDDVEMEVDPFGEVFGDRLVAEQALIAHVQIMQAH